MVPSGNVEAVFVVESEAKGDVIRNRDHVNITTISRESLDSFDVSDIDSPLPIHGNRIHCSKLPRLVAFLAKFIDEFAVLGELEDGIVERSHSKDIACPVYGHAHVEFGIIGLTTDGVMNAAHHVALWI